MSNNLIRTLGSASSSHKAGPCARNVAAPTRRHLIHPLSNSSSLNCRTRELLNAKCTESRPGKKIASLSLGWRGMSTPNLPERSERTAARTDGASRTRLCPNSGGGQTPEAPKKKSRHNLVVVQRRPTGTEDGRGGCFRQGRGITGAENVRATAAKKASTCRKMPSPFHVARRPRRAQSQRQENTWDSALVNAKHEHGWRESRKRTRAETNCSAEDPAHKGKDHVLNRLAVERQENHLDQPSQP